ncbi:YopX family protein [Latilactobacillus curvatus]|uniref:YopX family protein n=1 Tax=Latilactobacillus curvatus TaxID=28038 RepID=UPI0020A5F927|nr:YopX family protein [Latilactobacillus curvatus]UTC14266.1 hypothetical protein A4W80_04780 [Latilactobacillus curvatus]
MREIKFRVWDKTKHRMLGVCQLAFGPNGELVSIYSDGPDFSNDSEALMGDKPDLNEAVLMQYTGLKDVNGKDIYEGDIVKFFGANKKIKAKNEFGIIIYKADRYGAGFNSIIQNKEHGYGGINIAQDIVVGNVHENPELLEAD